MSGNFQDIALNQAKIVLLEFLDELYAANDLDSSFEALEKAVLKLGVEHLSYLSIPC